MASSAAQPLPGLVGSATEARTVYDDRSFFGHPRGLGLLFGVEMWERFSYYGMRALLVLYLTNALRWPDARASLLYGAYTGSVYLTPLLGGYLADRVLGTRRSLVVGGVLIATGHFLLAFGPGALPQGSLPPATAAMLPFYVGLVLIVIGTGFFKPNVSTMVGQLYRTGDSRRDAGFTIFYMGINLGAALAPLVCSYLGEKIGWDYGFGAAGVGMLLGLALYLYARGRLLPGIGLAPGASAGAATGEARNPSVSASAAPAAVGGGMGTLIRAIAGAAVAGGLALAASGGTPTLSGWLGVLMAASVGASVAVAIFGSWGEERRRVLAIVIVVLFAVFFWLAFEQAGSSMTLFAERHTNRTVGSFTFPTGWFQIVQPAFIIGFAPVAAAIWLALARRGREPSTAFKMVIGLVLVGAGFLFLVIAGRSADRGLLVSPFWLVGAYFLHSVGELCLSPVGLSYVTKVAPARFVSLLMGVWFIAIAAANYLGGYLASMMGEVGSQSQFFAIPLATSFGAALVMLLLVPWIRRLTRSVEA